MYTYIYKKRKTFTNKRKKDTGPPKLETILRNDLITSRIGVTPYFYIRYKNFFQYSDISLLRV